MAGKVAVIGEKEFRAEVLESKVPVFVDFFALWCGPCLAFMPSVEKLSEEMAGKLKVVKVDIDASMALAKEYDVHSIPTIIVFKDGKEVGRESGSHPYEALKAWVSQVL